MHTVFSLDDIKNPNLTFTTTSIYFVKAKMWFPFVKSFTWRQRLGSQEALMRRPPHTWKDKQLAENHICYAVITFLYNSEERRIAA